MKTSGDLGVVDVAELVLLVSRPRPTGWDGNLGLRLMYELSEEGGDQ